MTVAVEPTSVVEAWIAAAVPNQTFCDLGGIGVHSVNERITFASACGAKNPTMIDVRPGDYHEWTTFREICKQKGVTNYSEINSADINDPNLRARVGTFHLVHSTGILYHMPSPMIAFANLTTIVERFLITNTVTVPDRISNRFGTLEFNGSQALFLPGIDERERAILREHYETNIGLHFDRDVAPPLDDASSNVPYRENGEYSYWPYWWLFTDQAFRSLFPMLGFKILREWKWENHGLSVFAERMQGSGPAGR